MKTAILLLSGGIDSTTALHWLKHEGYQVRSEIVDYGQRHIREIDFAKRHCESLEVPFDIIELHRIKGLFRRSSLTDGSGDLVVPNRNGVLLNIGASIAVGLGNGCREVFIGCNKDDAVNFPDCREAFINTMNTALKWAQVGVEIKAPFIQMTKRQIVDIAREIGINLNDTYSCYRGEEEECGECLACQQRREALK